MKTLRAVCAFLLLTVAAFAQSTLPAAPSSFGQGTYYAPAYNYKTSVYSGGATAGGTYTITVFKPGITLADHRQVPVFSTSNSITIGQGAAQETVTPSSVSAACSNVNSGNRSCTITATFSNAHGQGDQITSGSGGVLEAFGDAAANGGGQVYWEANCGIITLNTGGVTTTTTCNVPKTFITSGASVYVTTTITTATSYSLGISGHTTTFMSGCTSLTAALNCSQFIPSPTSLAGGTGLGALLVTAAGGTPGAGAIHLKVWGYTEVQSSF